MKKISITALALVAALIISAVYAFSVQGEAASLSAHIVRLHILANSDSDVDQQNKLAVRDAIQEKYSGMLDMSADRDSACDIISTRLDEIEKTAAGVLSARGCDLPVRAYLCDMEFPERNYGEMSLPAGEYRALRIEIGQNAGKNWWCVIYPQMCLAKSGDKAIKAAYKAGLSDREIDLIYGKKSSVKVKFKILELLSNFRSFFAR